MDEQVHIFFNLIHFKSKKIRKGVVKKMSRANGHKKLISGTIFINKKGERMMIAEYDRYEGNNHYYRCISIDIMEDESREEIKSFQFSAIRSKSWTFGNSRKKYDDYDLYICTRRMFDHINSRIRTQNSYKKIENRFNNFQEFFNFVSKECEEDKTLRDKIVKKEVELDKDLLNFILQNDNKEYSEHTCLFVERTVNRSLIKNILKTGNLKIAEETLKLINPEKAKRPDIAVSSL
jgi:hypothetical protein